MSDPFIFTIIVTPSIWSYGLSLILNGDTPLPAITQWETPKVRNIAVKTNQITEEPIFFHMKCWKIYQKAKAREKKYKVSGELNAGVASIKGEIEEN